MERTGHRENVVDLARYRAERAQPELPLFTRPSQALPPATITPFRRLSERQVAHRARMLAHLHTARVDGNG